VLGCWGGAPDQETTMASYFGVENGNTSSGYLIANGNVYPAVSGFPPWPGSDGFRDIPAGSYTYQSGQPLDPAQGQYKSMSDGSGGPQYLQFMIIGSGKDGKIPEKRSFTTRDNGVVTKHPNGGLRDGIEAHFDGQPNGTAGCVGYQDNAAAADLTADPDKSMNVQYLGSQEAVQRAVELRLGHLVDWTKIAKPKTPGTTDGPQSKTKKGTKVRGNSGVRVGPNLREIVHQHAMLEGGGMVLEGNRTVVVGTEQYPVSRVAHMTSDGSPIADGEPSILLT
jgi:hypothetical protein